MDCPHGYWIGRIPLWLRYILPMMNHWIPWTNMTVLFGELMLEP